MTDDSSAAKAALKGTGKHRIIRHNIGQYVDGIIHTQSVESAFSLLKRGIIANAAHETVLRLLPPFVISREDVDEFLKTLDEVLSEVEAEKKQ